MHHAWFSHPTVDGHFFSSFYFWAFMNKATVEYMSSCGHRMKHRFAFLLGKYLGVELLEKMVSVGLTL